jgi:hypothetical protein
VKRDCMPDVFISYSTDSKKWAEKLAHSLREEGLETWTDFENLNPGERWFDQVQEALDLANSYVIVVGPRAVLADWQDRECQGALERTWSDPGKRIIPVLIGDTTPPAFLMTWGAIKLEPGRGESLAIKKAARTIKDTAAPEALERRQKKLSSGWRSRIRRIETLATQLK